MYNTWGGNEVLALEKITLNRKLVKIHSIWLPENINAITKNKLAKSFALLMVHSWCLHRFWTSELQYEPSGAWLSLVMAEIWTISHWMSLAVNDLKITVSLEKLTFLIKCEHFLGQPRDILFT